MASNDDAGADVRRNRRRVRVRKAVAAAAAETTTTNSSPGDIAAPDDDVDQSTGAEPLETESAKQNGSVFPPVSAAADHVRRIPATTINGSVDDSEHTSNQLRSEGDLDVRPASGTDDTARDGSHPPLQDDWSSHGAAAKKSRGKRRVKNRGRKAAQVTRDADEIISERSAVNGHEDAGDWFTAVRREDTATVRRLAEFGTVDVNSTDEVS